MDEAEPPVPEVPELPEEPSEPSEPVVIKKRRGRPPGSLNKKTIEKMKVEHEPSPALTLDVEFTSEAVLGETTPPPKRKPKTRAKPPPPPPTESGEDEPPPPRRSVSERKRPPPLENKGSSLNPPSYLEILTRGLKEQQAKQYAEKVAQYDRFFQW